MAMPVIACRSCGTKNRLPVVAHGTPRCASCKTALPWLVEAGDADFDAAVDTRALVVVDDSPRTATRYKAQSIPMLLLMDGGQVVDTLIGAQPGPIIRARVDGALARRP
jgi:thioredoxin 2